MNLGPCNCILQGLKVLFFTIGAIYLVYLVYLLFRAYSELRAMPYFGKFKWYAIMYYNKKTVSNSLTDFSPEISPCNIRTFVNQV